MPKKKKKFIEVKGASLHNLKNINVSIPHKKLTVITGLSGSGKTSLAFDTIYAEGQRRFVESLSSYARQFLERMPKPDVESIDALPPAISIRQNVPSRNPRSTVGTSTEIYDFLRLLFGRIGKTYCRVTGSIVKKDTADSVINDIGNTKVRSKLYILSFIPENMKYEDIIKTYVTNGYSRFFSIEDSEIFDFNDESNINKKLNPINYLLLVDRVIYDKNEDSLSRINESIEKAFNIGNGKISIYNLDNNSHQKFSNIYEDPDSGIVYVEPDPKLFSFNNPQGACPKCQGFGRTVDIDEDLVIPDRSLSLKNGAIAPFKGEKHSSHLKDLLKESNRHQINIEIPYSDLSPREEKIIWDGVGKYIGINKFFRKIEEKLYKVQNRVLLARYRGYTICKSCDGSRLRTSARQVFIFGKNIPELIKISLSDFYNFLINIKLTKYEFSVVNLVLDELKWRTKLLIDIGLDYLTLDRLAHTLSGGESQRISLATALGSNLVGTMYVLDEPTIGLHPTDTEKVLEILFKIKNLGNTVIVVEHDIDILLKADYIVDLGPLAGENGGELIYQGDIEGLKANKKSLTAKFINNEIFTKIRKPRKGHSYNITIYGAKENNLDIDEIKFPLGKIVVVTGVSGSGKSTLVHDILYAGIKRFRGGYKDKIGKYKSIKGIEYIEHVEMVDQSSIGKSSRSTPATYTKVFDYIREVFANTQEAKNLGWKPGYFSFNVNGGRCDICEGEGHIKVEMQFLPDVLLECESCKGTRYKKEVRNLEFKGKSIVEVLNMTVEEAIIFFADYAKIKNKLNVLQDVGLGYLKLGQPSSQLSGGEAQRLKLATHLDNRANIETLFIFDEPTTGLHPYDIEKLQKSFDKLIEQGHSIVVIEHNVQIILQSDHIIDLGPGAGINGGKVMATGTPQEIMNNSKSLTGYALNKYFAK